MERIIDEAYDLALRVAREAGAQIVSLRNSSSLSVSLKADASLVTNADTTAEKFILGEIRSRFPEHQILAEESVKTLSKDPKKLLGPLWIVDPIDGTTNFAHGHAQCAVSIAFAYDGKIQVGVVEAPFYRETFHAKRGGGAYLNQKPIKVSGLNSIKTALISTGVIYNPATIELTLNRIRAVTKATTDIRRLGACSLDVAWVAAGRLDGYYESVNLWDIAAARIIAHEAGARIGHLIEKNSSVGLPDEFRTDDCIVATPGVYDELAGLLRSAS